MHLSVPTRRLLKSMTASKPVSIKRKKIDNSDKVFNKIVPKHRRTIASHGYSKRSWYADLDVVDIDSFNGMQFLDGEYLF
jgi:hypothetical protein